MEKHSNMQQGDKVRTGSVCSNAVCGSEIFMRCDVRGSQNVHFRFYFIK